MGQSESWNNVKVQYDELLKQFKQTEDISDLYKAFVYIKEFYTSNHNCLPAAYEFAMCHYGALIYDANFANPNFAISVLKRIYREGYVEASYLLGKFYAYTEKYSQAFNWTKIYTEHNPDSFEAMRRLAIMYSQGRGTVQNHYAADIIFQRLQEKCEDDYDFVYSYAEHLLRKHSIESFYWIKKACTLTPDLFELGNCFLTIVEIALAFGDLNTAYIYSDELKKLIKKVNDDYTKKHISESYYISQNDITLYKMEHQL